MLDRFSAWLFRRFRRHLFVVLEVGSALFLLGILGVLSLVTVGHYFHLAASEVAICLVVAGGVILGTDRVGLYVLRSKLAPARAWFRGDAVAPEDAWGSLLVAVKRITWLNAILQLPMHSIVTAAVITRYAELDLSGWLGLQIALCGVYLAGVVLILQAFHFLARPALIELAPQLPADIRLPERGLSIASRLTMGVTATGMLAGVFVLMWVGTAAEPNRRFMVGALISVVVAAYMTLVIRAALIDPALSPLDDVLAATRRVNAGDYSTPVAITSADELGDLGVAFNVMQRGLLEREALQNAFGSYVDPALARRLLEQGSSVFEGEEVDVSVFFADIRGFTAFAEGASVRDAVATVNRFFSIVVRVVSELGGHTNAYLGDGVLVVFGTPLPLSDHADRAVAAARAIQREVNQEFGEALRIGIGVNTGPVIAGTVGGEGRLEFTVIGDPVNVAARVEQLTKETGDGILVTAATCLALSGEVELTDRGEFDVRGKQNRVRLFSVDAAALS